jgi:amino acid adenylation domain-containing protein
VADAETIAKLRALSPARRRALEKLLAERGAGSAAPVALEARAGSPDGATRTDAAVTPRRAHAPRIPRLSDAERRGPLPLSTSQRRLWFLERFEGQGGTYNVPMAWRLVGACDVDALERALFALVTRHEVLRTVLVPSAAGEPEAWLLDAPSVDHGRLSLAREDVPAFVEAEATRRFALDRECPLRWRVVAIGPEEHVLVLVFHHVAMDGWSMGILTRELWALYGAFRAGATSPLPEPALQYADFAAWQRARFASSGDALAAHEAGWVEALAGAPHLLELWGDRPRPAVISYRGDVVHVDLGRARSQRVRALAQRLGATPFMVLAAAYSAMLSRRSGQADVLVGTPVAGRLERALEDVVGCFINTLALRTRPAPDKTFEQHVFDTRAASLAAFERQEVPFERVVDRLGVERSLAHTPLVQAMIVLQNTPSLDFGVPGLRLEHLPRGRRAAMLDLTLTLSDRGEPQGAFSGELEYATDVFDRATAEALVGHLTTFLDAALDQPSLSIGALPLLTPSERARVLIERQGPALDCPTEQSLFSLVAAQARQTPERVAVERGAATMSYAALVARAEAIARALVLAGVVPGDHVGILVDRTIDLVPTLLAVLRAGGTYVPLDPAYPEMRLAQMLERTAPRLVIDDASTRGAIAVAAERRTVDELCAAAADAPVTLPHELATDRLAYVLFTSGSTGRPKGVQVRERGVVNFLWAMRALGIVAPEERFLAIATTSFDVSVLELYGPLLVGGTVVLATRREAMDGHALRALLEGGRVDVLQATPPTWRLLRDARLSPGHLRRALVGAEPLARELAAWMGGVADRVVNLYGPTETTVWCTTDDVRPGDEPTLGRPIGNMATYVLDAQRALVPDGVAGELWIAGVGVAAGYAALPDETAQRFVDLGSTLGLARLVPAYRTGDRVRWLPDGRLDFLGRVDFQVKVRGYRVELGEIESVLSGLTGVRAAAAIARGDVLIAYVVPELDGRDAPPAEGRRAREPLRGRALAALRAALPDYMVPQHLVELPELPLTPSRKLDRQRLPAPSAEGDDGAPTTAPRDGLERALLAVFREVLGDPGAGIEDSFFDRGGHSLLAVQLVDRVERAVGRTLELADVFRAPTVRGLARVLAGEVSASGDGHAIEDLRPEGSEPPIFFVGSTPFGRRLARHLPEGRPVYGLNLFSYSNGRVIPDVIDLAALGVDYARQIVAREPRGPYHLLAYCGDAFLALEVARALDAGKHAVGLLGIIDPVWAGDGSWREQLIALAGNLGRFGAGYVRKVAARRLGFWRERTGDRFGALRTSFGQQLGVTTSVTARHQQLIVRYRDALRRYRIPMYPRRVTLFVSAEKQHIPARRVFLEVSSEVVTRVVPGFHDEMFHEPNVETLAAAVEASMPGPRRR